MSRRLQTVYGHAIPAPRITYRAVGLAVLCVGLPILAAGFALDVLVWAVGRAAFDTCIGLWCR